MLERATEEPGPGDLDLLARGGSGRRPRPARGGSRRRRSPGSTGSPRGRGRRPSARTIRGFTSSWSWPSTSMTQACSASPSCGAARPTPGASRIVWARSSSSSWRYLPKLSTGLPLSRRRGSPRRTMGRTLMAAEYRRATAQAGRSVRRSAASVGGVGGGVVGRGGRLGARPPASRGASASSVADRRAEVGRPVARLRGELAAGVGRSPRRPAWRAAPAFSRGDGGELGGLARRPRGRSARPASARSSIDRWS